MDRRLWRASRPCGFVPIVALGIACAVAVELAVEVAGFDPEGAVVSVRHGVLAAVGIVALAAFGAYLAFVRRSSTGTRDFKRRLRLDLAASPGGVGSSDRLALVAGFTFSVGSLAQLGQHDLARPSDVFGWFVAALLSAILLAVLVRAVVRRLPELVAALVAYFGLRPIASPWLGRARAHVSLPSSLESWSPSRYNRPPPVFPL